MPGTIPRGQAGADPRPPADGRMTGQAWVLFAAMSVIWGVPYLFIKVALEQLSPAALVLCRTGLALLVLVPVALVAGALRPALPRWRLGAGFGVLEMGIPWVLLAHAEQRVASGLAGLMLASVPIVGAAVAALLGDRHNLARVRLAGMGIGVVGVAALVGLDSISGALDWLSAAELLTVAVCYAVAPIVVDRRGRDVPALGTITVALGVVAVAYLPFGVPGVVAAWPLHASTAASVLVLGWVCTALAFVLFFRLIAVAGPVRAVVITFVNPAVAIVLGLVVLGEPVTAGMALGFPLVLLGSWLATRPSGLGPDPTGRPADRRPDP